MRGHDFKENMDFQAILIKKPLEQAWSVDPIGRLLLTYLPSNLLMFRLWSLAEYEAATEISFSMNFDFKFLGKFITPLD